MNIEKKRYFGKKIGLNSLVLVDAIDEDPSWFVQELSFTGVSSVSSSSVSDKSEPSNLFFEIALGS